MYLETYYINRGVHKVCLGLGRPFLLHLAIQCLRGLERCQLNHSSYWTPYAFNVSGTRSFCATQSRNHIRKSFVVMWFEYLDALLG